MPANPPRSPSAPRSQALARLRRSPALRAADPAVRALVLSLLGKERPKDREQSEV